VPIAARVLHRLLRRVAPRYLVFSAFGLREGHLYSLLDEAEQRVDPLLAGCEDFAASNRRFGADGEELFGWTAPLFADEDQGRRRLRRAAALLSDIAWHEHPDYRADQACRSALYMPIAGLDHSERAFLAATLRARYGGGDGGMDVLYRLLDDDAMMRARVTGLALRLGYTLSGGVPRLLARSKLALENGTLALSLSDDGARRFGENVQRRLDALGRSLGRRTEIRKQ
jgi:exopolyphosphatase/guanosine-5'-triphosphate,3'-diphosphate pyrophosphatase